MYESPKSNNDLEIVAGLYKNTFNSVRRNVGSVTSFKDKEGTSDSGKEDANGPKALNVDNLFKFQSQSQLSV